MVNERFFSDFVSQNQKKSARSKCFLVASGEKGLFTQPHAVLLTAYAPKSTAWAKKAFLTPRSDYPGNKSDESIIFLHIFRFFNKHVYLRN